MHVRPISIPRSTSPHAADGKAFTYPSMHTGALLPRHSNTDAHDCVHTSPCIPWRAHTWHAGTRAPAAPTLSLAARRRRAVAASAPPQHALQRRLGASWCSRPGEQACGQRRGHSDKSGLGRRRRSPAPSVSATAAGLWHRSSRCTSKKFFWGLAQQLPAEPSLFSRCPSHARISMCVTCGQPLPFFLPGLAGWILYRSAGSRCLSRRTSASTL